MGLFNRKAKSEPKQTLATIMAEIANEVRELNATNVDLQKYITSIEDASKRGYKELDISAPREPGATTAVVESLRRLGFKARPWSGYIEIKW